MNNTMTGREVLRAIADGASAEDFEWSDGPAWGSVENTWAIHDFTQERTTFRRTPRTINIRGFDVPAPEPADRLIPKGVTYFVPTPGQEYWHKGLSWSGDDFDHRALQRGLVYLNREDAIRVAKAMCGIDPDTQE